MTLTVCKRLENVTCREKHVLGGNNVYICREEPPFAVNAFMVPPFLLYSGV